MRLTCPNCGAQYEVPDDVIPEEGRDVQCSNCGDTWFQQPAGFVAKPPLEESPSAEPSAPAPTADQAEEAEADVEFASAPTTEEPDESPEPDTSEDPTVSPDDGGLDEPLTSSETEEDPAPEVRAEDERDDGVAEDTPEETAAPETPAERPEPSGARGIDPALGDILREEAEREANLRAAAQQQSQGLETQTNLGLDDLPENEEARRSRQAKDRMARIQGQDTRRLAAEASGLKRGVLPDIEEINSSLRAYETPPPPPAPDMTPRPRKSGFTRGFALVILVAVAMVMAYSKAPEIAEVVPQADPYLSNYVAWVDELRLWLDTQVSSLQQPQS